MGLRELAKELRETLGAPTAVPTGWKGYSAWASGSLMIDPQVGSQPFPYRTKTADVVWKEAEQLIPRYPHMSEKQLLALAVKNTGVRPLDLAPEDWRLLEMAVEWRKNGTTGIPKPRIGGMPGGPANDAYYPSGLAKPGAP